MRPPQRSAKAIRLALRQTTRLRYRDPTQQCLEQQIPPFVAALPSHSSSHKRSATDNQSHYNQSHCNRRSSNTNKSKALAADQSTREALLSNAKALKQTRNTKFVTQSATNQILGKNRYHTEKRGQFSARPLVFAAHEFQVPTPQRPREPLVEDKRFENTELATVAPCHCTTTGTRVLRRALHVFNVLASRACARQTEVA